MKSLQEEANKSWLLAVCCIALIVLIALTLSSTLSDAPVKMKAHCRLSGIELKDVRPQKCYSEFSSQFCPVPKEIDCSLEGEAPANYLQNINTDWRMR